MSMAACEAPLHLSLPDKNVPMHTPITSSYYDKDLIFMANDWHAGTFKVVVNYDVSIKLKRNGICVFEGKVPAKWDI